MILKYKPPFTKEIIEEPLLKEFKVSQFEPYKGTIDPTNYFESFKALMLLQGALETIMYQTFLACLGMWHDFDIQASDRAQSTRSINFVTSLPTTLSAVKSGGKF